jgi:hypothetical protein
MLVTVYQFVVDAQYLPCASKCCEIGDAVCRVVVCSEHVAFDVGTTFSECLTVEKCDVAA